MVQVHGRRWANYARTLTIPIKTSYGTDNHLLENKTHLSNVYCPKKYVIRSQLVSFCEILFVATRYERLQYSVRKVGLNLAHLSTLTLFLVFLYHVRIIRRSFHPCSS
jgi:hypothetical protein